jgi:hypothetical protein
VGIFGFIAPKSFNKYLLFGISVIGCSLVTALHVSFIGLFQVEIHALVA